MPSDFRDQPELVRPRVTPSDATRIAEERWGVIGTVVELGSQQERNFRIGDGARRHLLKVSNPVFSAGELLAQGEAATAVAAHGLGATTAHPSLAGREVETVELDGQTLAVRMLHYVEGEPLTGVGAFDAVTASALGDAAARVVEALAPLRHSAATRVTQWNLRIADDVVRMLLPSVADGERRDRIARLVEAARARLAGVRDELRVQTVHGDVTDDNVVRAPGSEDGAITGIIDFGDVAESWLVAELAVACTAVLHHDPRDPLRVLDTIDAFHARVPLDADEIAALWPLVQLRTAVLAVSGAQQVAVDPDNAYARANLAHEWLAFVTAESLDAEQLHALIRRRLDPTAAVLPAPGILIDLSHATELDLSTTSALLDGGAWLEPDIEERLLAEGTGTAGTVTAWGVPRLTRARRRMPRGAVATIPLGVDAGVAAGTELRAPFAGTLRREGAEVVLASDGVELRLRGAAVDEAGAIAAGDRLGAVAASGRLSVQLSLLGGGVRPPDFATPGDAAVWLDACPDPSPLLGRVPSPAARPADGASDAAALLATRDAAFARVQEHYFAHPPRIERGWREHFVDTDGQTYVDMVNNVATVGHGHPRLVAAVSRQWALQNANSRFHYGAVAEFSARLADLAPDGLDTVYLVNSGSEAVDLALRLATVATGRPTVLAMREAYHGWTIGSDAVSSSLGDNPRALETRPDWVRLLDAPNTFRGTHRGPDSAPAYLADLETQLAGLDASGVPIAGFIAEAVYGNAGGVLLPDGYLAGAYAAVRSRGGLCIADEVQVGYGRLGGWFWGFEQQGVVPDIITIAKAMGNGHPLGAVITTRAISDAFAAEGSLFSSAGGSPVSCVVGSTVLDIMRDERLQENAAAVGEHLRAGLLALQGRHRLIGAVHGRGLYLGVELVRSRSTLEPATAAAAAVCDLLLAEGVIVQPTGDHKNVLKIKPPMVITRESVDYFLEALDRVLGEV